MALIQATLFSQSLMRTVNVNVILPVDKLSAPGQALRPEQPLKTLYLLHGVFGSYVDWVAGTRIQRYAEAHNLAVVMPSGENAFYVDQAAGHRTNSRKPRAAQMPRVTRKPWTAAVSPRYRLIISGGTRKSPSINRIWAVKRPIIL